MESERMADTEMMAMVRWGTWEELVLGSAVLRHGTQDWEAVAAELQARTLYPYCFTAEVCKAKYEDLQERYYGCTGWFEELRKQRVAELKRELEKSEDSIGSLESKLKSLKAERREDRHTDYDSSRTESPVTLGNSVGVEFSGKETSSKDGLSVGSFTEETPTNWSLEHKDPTVVSAQEADDVNPVSFEDSERDRKKNTVNKPEITVGADRGGNLRKRRGKRKRKECGGGSKDVKEGSVGENDVLSSADAAAVAVPDKEESTRDCNRCVRSTYDGADVADLIGIFNSIVENDCASTFRRRLDSQRRSRYKRTVRRHLDFDTIRSRIIERSITSTKELFRDLLLLANNAAVFYPKNTRQYKSALALRELAKITFRPYLRDFGREPSSSASEAPALLAEVPTLNPPVKPRSARPCNRKGTGKVAGSEKPIAETTPSRESKKASDATSPVESLAMTKKGVGRPAKVGRGSSRKRTENLSKGRKRTRRS